MLLLDEVVLGVGLELVLEYFLSGLIVLGFIIDGGLVFVVGEVFKELIDMLLGVLVDFALIVAE